MSGETRSSIEKALLILEELGKEPYEYKAAVLAERLGINRTTTYRTLSTLEEYGMVVLDRNTQRYKMGPNMYHLGVTYLYNHNYRSQLNDILSEISEITRESVGMAIREGDKIVSIIEIEVHQPMKFNDVPGRYFQGNKGNYGKCIMAYQDEAYINEYLDSHTFEKTLPNTLNTKEELLAEYAKIRKQGYSESIDELGVDVLGTGIPLFGTNGEIKACVAVGFYRQDGWEEKLVETRNVLFKYQRDLEKCMP